MSQATHSQAAYSKILDRKILYRDPLFIVDVKLQDSAKTGGQDNNVGSSINNNINNSLVKEINGNEETRVRFMFCVHNEFEQATLLLREYYHTQDFQIFKSAQRKEKSLDIVPNEYKTYKLLDGYFASAQDIPTAAKKISDKKVICREYDVDKNSKRFIEMWLNILDKHISSDYSKQNIIDSMQKAGYKFIENYYTRYVVELNPDYSIYLVFEKV